MKKSTKTLLLGMGVGLVLGVILEYPEEFAKFMKALRDEKTERVEIDITPKKVESHESGP